MKNWQRPCTWVIAIVLFSFAPLVSSAQTSNSPYIRDVQKAFIVRKLLRSQYAEFNPQWSSNGEKGKDSLMLQGHEILVKFVEEYLQSGKAPIDGVKRDGNATQKKDSLPKGKLTVKGAQPQPGEDQPKAGPYDQPIATFTVSKDRFEQPVHEEVNELVHELEAMLLVTDTTAIKEGRLTYFSNFPATFPHAGGIITYLQSKGAFTASISLQSGAANMIPNAGTIVNNIIYGITDWAIKTAKRQLLEAVLDKYYLKLESDEITKTLLTSTLNVYTKFKEDNSAVALAKYGDLWKKSFEADLQKIPDHLQDETFVNKLIDKVAPDWTAKNEVVPLITGSTAIVYGISQKEHPVTILDKLGDGYVTNASSLQTDLPIFKRTVVLANVVTRIIGEMKAGVYQTLDLKDLRDLTQPEWIALLGLTYSRNRVELTLSLGKDPVDILAEIKAGPQANFYNLLVTAISDHSAMRNLLASSVLPDVDTQQKKLTAEEISKVVQLAGSLVKTGLPYISKKANLPVNTIVNIIEENWDPVSQAIAQIGEGVTTKEYGAVLDGTLQLLVRGNTVFSQLSGKPSKLDNDVIVAFTRYGSMMVNILSAKTPEAITEALDELVPRDQYKLKNMSQWSFSLSMYPGVFGGWETIRKQDPNIVTKPNPTTKSVEGNFSVYLPVGLDVSWGTGKSAWILFAQALDLGAVLNYRLTGSESTEQSNPNISLQQLLSPGLSFMHQFRNTPLVLGTGINYTPGLRKIEETNVTYNANAFRFGFFFGVDITALHISLSKTKKH